MKRRDQCRSPIRPHAVVLGQKIYFRSYSLQKNSYEPYLILEALCILGAPVRLHSPHGPKNAPALFNPGSNHVLGLFVIFSGYICYIIM